MILDKMKLAHEMALRIIDLCPELTPDELAERCFKYADAMQAEADKRKVKGVPEAIEQEWQPDWSVAPYWAVVYTRDVFGGQWWNVAPRLDGGDVWVVDSVNDYLCASAPNFGYQGDWRNSLRRRPEGK